MSGGTCHHIVFLIPKFEKLSLEYQDKCWVQGKWTFRCYHRPFRVNWILPTVVQPTFADRIYVHTETILAVYNDMAQFNKPRFTLIYNFHQFLLQCLLLQHSVESVIPWLKKYFCPLFWPGRRAKEESDGRITTRTRQTQHHYHTHSR